MLAMMVKLGVASANICPDPCTCRLVGLVMVFWLLSFVEFVDIRI